MEIRTYKKGDIIFREGDKADCMYCVADKDSAVVIYADYATETQRSLTVCRTGTYFGEMALEEGGTRSATAVALTDVALEVISKETFDRLLTEKPDEVHNIISNAAGRLRNLTAQYLEAGVVMSKYFKSIENGEKPSREVLDQMQKYVQ